MDRILRRPDEIPESSFHANKISPVAPNGYAPKRGERAGVFGRRRQRQKEKRYKGKRRLGDAAHRPAMLSPTLLIRYFGRDARPRAPEATSFHGAD